MLKKLREEAWKVNIALPQENLVVGTHGNVSGIDRDRSYVVIKPSGVAYKELSLDNMVIMDLEGKVVEDKLKPSVDTPHHLYLYKFISDIGSIIHTHSPYATMFALLERSVPVYKYHACRYFRC